MLEQLFLAIAAILALILSIIGIKLSKHSKKWKPLVFKKLIELDSISKSDDPYKIKHALIEADKLLDHVMKMKGMKGTDMGSRLKLSKKYFEWNTYNSIWEAHKMRNRLVHEVEMQGSVSEIKKYYKDLGKGIRILLK